MKKNQKPQPKLACRKHRFKDHKQAVAALHSAANRRQMAQYEGFETRRNEVRSYKCSRCSGFHITSQLDWNLAA